jgi:hypothetical protein
VAVKKGLTRYSAGTSPGRRAADDRGRRLPALSPPIKTKPYIPAKPTTITIDLSTVDTALQYKGRAGVEIVRAAQVVSKGKTGCRRGSDLEMVRCLVAATPASSVRSQNRSRDADVATTFRNHCATHP